MSEDWAWEIPAAVTITDAQGMILAMNRAAREVFKADGGATLIGTNALDCHPEPARTKTAELYAKKAPNHYTVRKAGLKKMIHQVPWYKDGAFSGFVEFSFPIPEEMPHFDRG